MQIYFCLGGREARSLNSLRIPGVWKRSSGVEEMVFTTKFPTETFHSSKKFLIKVIN